MSLSYSITQLEYAVAVATHGHFGRAAAACDVSQPALSMQLRKLEQSIGVELFDRSRQPVVPTAIGEILIEQARVVLREAGHLADLRNVHAGVVAGELRVGVIPTLAPYLLPRFLRTLTADFPELRLAVDELPTDRLLEALRTDALDLALIATAPDTPGLSQRSLFREPLFVYAHVNHPLARLESVRAEELSGTDVWLLSEEHCLREQTVRLCRDRHALDGQRTRAAARSGHRNGSNNGSSADTSCAHLVRFESGNVETLRRLVEGGDGFTLLPQLALPQPVPGEARVIPFENHAAYREIRAVQRRVALKRPLVEAFLNAVVQSVEPELGALCAVPNA